MTASEPVCAAAPQFRRSPGDLRRSLRRLAIAIFLLLVTGTGLALAYLRDQALNHAEMVTSGVARLLDDHLSRTLSATDAMVSRAARLRAEHLRGQLSLAELQHELVLMEAALAQRATIIIVDASGEVLVSSRPLGRGERMNVSHRDYFRDHRDGSDRVIGPMIKDARRGEPIFTVSRQVVGDDGAFAGAAVVGIYARFFTDFFTTMGLGPGGYIGANTSGRVMLRQPDPDRFVGRDVSGNAAVIAARTEPVGTLRMVAPVDQVERVVSYRLLPEFNVMVSAGMAMEDILAPWRRTALWILGALVLVLTGLGGMTWAAFRTLTREELVVASLEETVRNRTAEAEERASEAKAANESKTRFLAAASHDLRQPLQAAGMFVEVLAGQLEDDPGRMKVVDRLRQSIEATNSLLATLLDVSALEAGKTKANPVSFRLMPLLAGLVDQMEPEASRKGLAIGAVPTSVEVVSDPVLLERLLRNLLVNAVRYTQSGRILVGCRRRGDRVAVQVWDTGIGIPPEKQAVVFDDFIRLDNVAERSGARGLGLGLGVVRRMAVLLGHGLNLRSTPGKGSCFEVVVPRS